LTVPLPNLLPPNVLTPTALKRVRRLGNFYFRRRLASEAESEYLAALRLSPQFSPAAINLADLYREVGRDKDGERVLRTAIDNSPGDAGLHHALGLALTRLNRTDEAMVELRHATNLEPSRPRYLYVYAVALHSAGYREMAIAVLKEFSNRQMEDRDILLAVVTFSRDAGDLTSALEYGERLAGIVPDDREIANFVQSLRDGEAKRKQ
jgi:Tfp pilus assembly protein PilF